MDTEDDGKRGILDEMMKDRIQFTEELFRAIKSNLDDLEALWTRCDDHWCYEDGIYRFYHHSFKVYALQDLTLEIVAALRSLLPGTELNKDFLDILMEGTGKSFTKEVNKRWSEETRPILEAFFHARYFLEMAVRYGRNLESAPQTLPSGWAAFLYLFNLR